MPAKNFYDAVLVGLDLPTLLTGALLAKRGFRVLVVGQGQPTPSYDLVEAPGVRFPRAPFLLTAPASPALSRVFSELALRPLVQRRTQALAPTFQAVLPGHRVDLGADPARLGLELEREFPEARRVLEALLAVARDEASAIDALVGRDLVWPSSGFFERRELTRALAASPLAPGRDEALGQAALEPEHVLTRLLAASVELTAGSALESLHDARARRLVHALLAGAELGEGGLPGLFELLVESIRTHNGSLRLSERVATLPLGKRGIERLQLLPSDEEIGCHFVLWGLPIERLAPLVGDAALLAPSFEEVGEPQPRARRFTLNLLVRAEAIPEGMARHVLLAHPAAPADEPLWIEVERLPDGARALMTIEARVPARDGALEASPGAQRARMLDALTLLSPFLRQHLLLVDSPHDGGPVEDVQAGSTRVPTEAGRRGPDTMETLYAFARTSPQGVPGVTALPVRTSVKHLLLCNGQVVPGLGLEGAFLTAWSAARVVTRALNRDWMNRGRWTKVEL